MMTEQVADCSAEITELLAILTRLEALKGGLARVREIGAWLDGLGGIEMMRLAYYEITLAFQRRPASGIEEEDNWHPSELNYAWDGIGNWLA